MRDYRLPFLTAAASFCFALMGCSHGLVGPAVDSTAPGAVATLSERTWNLTSVTLVWVAPGNDGSSGTAASYDLRFSSAPINAGNFASAAPVSAVPAPAVAGSVQEVTVSGLTTGTTYYFALRAKDEAGNVSALSNVLAAAPSTDLPFGLRAEISGTPWSADAFPGDTVLAVRYDVYIVSLHAQGLLAGARRLDAHAVQRSEIGFALPGNAHLATYSLGDVSAASTATYAWRTITDASGTKSWMTDAAHTGTLQVTNVVLNQGPGQGVVSGTFSFLAHNSSDGSNVVVSGGTFTAPVFGTVLGSTPLDLGRAPPGAAQLPERASRPRIDSGRIRP